MATPGSYHHGDLRAALLSEAAVMLGEVGIDGLSLRKLAERVGVSRMAPYHHFRDKHDLLCALASEGFGALQQLVDNVDWRPGDNLHAALGRFVRAYIDFATSEPERYELMFGRPIWKSAHPTEALRQTAHACFRDYAELIRALLGDRQLPQGSSPLRLAQASWATLHGLCRLVNDGIYIDVGDMRAVSDEAIRVMLAGLS